MCDERRKKCHHGLRTVFLGGFDSAKTHAAVQRWMPSSHTVLGMLPIGCPADPAASVS